MSLFLFRPHVVGPEDNITTPDIVIDRVFVDGSVSSVNNLTSETYLQLAEGETAKATYVITALGGGALIGPAFVLSSGRIVVTRQAWRLNNLSGTTGDVTLNGTTLSALTLPADLIAAAGGHGDTLPRGYQVLCTASEANSVKLEDPTRGRSLSTKLVTTSVNHDRWGDDRPKPRYSIGPTQKEIPHFI